MDFDHLIFKFISLNLRFLLIFEDFHFGCFHKSLTLNGQCAPLFLTFLREQKDQTAYDLKLHAENCFSFHHPFKFAHKTFCLFSNTK